jgi:hypothetical protein
MYQDYLSIPIHCNVPKPNFFLGTLIAHCLFVFSYVFVGLIMELHIRVYVMMINQ